MNNRGQAMIESLMVGLILLAGLSFLFRYALIQYHSILLNELIEQTLICSFERPAEKCKSNLLNKLNSLKFKSVEIHLIKQFDKCQLKLKYISALGRIIEKESELQLELKVNN